MKVIDLFRKLSFGELSNLSISGSGSGTILTEKQPQVIQYINDGLTALHSRFLLIEKDLILEQVGDISTYHLTSQYAQYGGAAFQEENRYIKDLPEAPFKDDLLRVLEIFHISGQKYVLNDTDTVGSLFTPTPHTLQIPHPCDGEPMAIVYQAKHPEISDTDINTNLDINIPHYLEKPLKSFVAARVFQHMGGQQNMITSQSYDMAFDIACQEIENKDLVNQTVSNSNTKLEEKGFP